MRKAFLFGALALWASVAGQVFDPVSSRIQIELRPDRAQPEVAAMVAQGIGRITARHGNAYTIRLYSNVDLAEVLERTSQRPSVSEAWSLAPAMPANLPEIEHVTRLRAVVESYKRAYEEHIEVVGEPESEDADVAGEVPGLDFLEAYLQHFEDRAYPYDEFPYDLYESYLRQEINEYNALGKLNILQVADVEQWEFMGPTNLDVPYRTYWGIPPVSGRANALAISHADPNTFYMGAAQGGVWKSTDAGATWSPLTDDWPALHVSSIEIDPTNANVIYVGTGDFHGFEAYAIGLMKSTDGGAKWTNLAFNVLQGASVSDIVVYPEDPSTIVITAGRSGPGGVFRSTDGGQTWSEEITSNISWSGLDVGAPSAGVRALYAVAGTGGGGSLWRSMDAGANWTQLTSPVGGDQSALQVAASRISPGTLYVMFSNSDRVFKSSDFGATWSDATSNLPTGYNWGQSWYDYHLNTSWNGTQDVVYIGLIDVLMSPNGGASWQTIGGPTYSGSAVTHNDQHSFALDPSNPNRFIFGNDGGVYLGTYNPTANTTSVSRLSADLGITQFYSLSIHPSDPDYVMGGTQDNATPHSGTGLANWNNVGGGDGAGNAINQFNPNYQYSSSQYQNVYRTWNQWGNTDSFSPNWGNDRRPFIGRMTLDPNNGRYLYVGTNYLWAWDEDNNSWQARLGGQQLSSSSTLRAIEVALGDSNRIYTGSADGELWMTTNRGAAWTRIDGPLPNRAIYAININPNNPNDILVGLVGSSSPRVWRCLNPTAPTPTWTNVSGSGANGLPDLPTNAIERHPDDPESTWFAGNDFGVWMTEDAGSSWVDVTAAHGLPNVQVNQLEANTTTDYLTAATFGRGMWRLDLTSVELTSLQLDREWIVGGEDGSGTVAIDAQAGAGGVEVQLQSDNPNVIVPATVTVPAGSTTAIFPYTSVNVNAEQSATIMASLDGSSASDSLTVYSYYPAFAMAIELNFANLIAGGPQDLAETDGQVVRMLSNIPRTTRIVRIDAIISYTSPSPTANSMTVAYSAESIQRVCELQVSLWDWIDSEWEQVDVVPALTSLVERSVEVAGADRFVQAGTGAVRVRMRYERNGSGASARWATELDKAMLKIKP